MITFSFNNTSSNSDAIKVLVKSSTHLSIQGKTVEFFPIPGRSDALIIDEGVKPNKDVTVIFIVDERATKNLKGKLTTIENWLVNTTGYKKLTFNDGYSFDAAVNGGVEVKKIYDNVAECTVKFSCKAV